MGGNMGVNIDTQVVSLFLDPRDFNLVDGSRLELLHFPKPQVRLTQWLIFRILEIFKDRHKTVRFWMQRQKGWMSRVNNMVASVLFLLEVTLLVWLLYAQGLNEINLGAHAISEVCYQALSLKLNTVARMQGYMPSVAYNVN